MLLIIASALASFACTVTKAHDGNGPLWCANGMKVRVACVQAPEFESAEPCRRRRDGYVCSNAHLKADRPVSTTKRLL
ncbi:hypothetical protein ACT009_08790 [Sphingomonas sp. Tas61C01]|uniref:hypothetical protein n=1 Tax=Sphingomonas sp. Tas61C01 TaxID=3458297 RepID=UPI00403EE706